MATARSRVKAPETAKAGEVFPVKTLLRHRMETGLRTDDRGEVIPRHIINRFVCRYDGDVVFSVDLKPAVSANTFLEFYVVARQSGTLAFYWYEDGGEIYTAQHRITVN
jgi:sulfur-oxidizing protein SoxZ